MMLRAIILIASFAGVGGLHAAAADVAVPPYYPDTPGIRRSLARRMELAAALDADVGRILADLAADVLADDTIVFFWGDHGEGIPHGKRSLTEHGLRVPLLVHVPERFAARAALPGSQATRGQASSLVSLMDLGPTVLSLAGIGVPKEMEGRPFLGRPAAPRDVVIAARDRMDSAPGFGRSVRDQRFRYVRNFLPWLDGDDLPPYADGVAITGELRAAKKAGSLPPGASWFARTSRPADELYDIAADVTTGRVKSLLTSTTRSVPSSSTPVYETRFAVVVQSVGTRQPRAALAPQQERRGDARRYRGSRRDSSPTVLTAITR